MNYQCGVCGHVHGNYCDAVVERAIKQARLGMLRDALKALEAVLGPEALNIATFTFEELEAKERAK